MAALTPNEPTRTHADVSKTTPWNDGGGPSGRDVFALTAHMINCQSSVLTGFRLENRTNPTQRTRQQIRFAYTCLDAGKLMSTAPLYSPWASMQTDGSFLSLATVHAACKDDKLALSYWQLVRDTTGALRARFQITCAGFSTRLSCSAHSTPWSPYGSRQNRAWMPHNVACEHFIRSGAACWWIA